ncbi:MAG: hypothetical protein IKU01_01580 [Bacteroidales bacterium]|nr:hypothetical protein [Bacteroidales bacterium]
MTLDTVKLGRLVELVNRLERDGIDFEEEISFEFLIANCFPLIYENIKSEMTKKYIEGFKAGLQKAAEKEGKKNETPRYS